MRRRQLVDAFKDGLGLGHVAEGEKILHRPRPNPPVQAVHGAQRGQFGPEHEILAGAAGRRPSIIEGLLAQPVAGTKQLLPVTIPQDEREHSGKPRNAGRPPLFPSVNDGFGVTAVPEHMTERRQFHAKRLKIIYLSIKND